MRLARRTLLGAGAALAGGGSAARDAPPVAIGLLLALTGPLSRASEEIAFGFALALDEVSWRAGGRPLKVLVEDTQNRPPHAVQRFAKLVGEDRIDLAVGPTGSAEALALRDAAHDSGIPLVVPNAGVDALTGERCSPFVIRVSYANEQIAAPLGAWLAEYGGVRSAYLLATDNTAGRDHVAAFRRTFGAGGGEIAGEELVPPATRDFTPYLGKLKLVRTEALFASFFGDAAQRLLENLEALDLRGLRLCGPGWLASTLDLGRVGARAAGIIGSAIWLPDLDDPGNRAFVSAFTSRHQRPPTEFAAQGYDAGRLVVAALDALDGETRNRRALAAVLARTPFTGARGELSIDPQTNNVVQSVYIFETRARTGGEGLDFEILHRSVGVAVDPALCTMPP